MYKSDTIFFFFFQFDHSQIFGKRITPSYVQLMIIIYKKGRFKIHEHEDKMDKKIQGVKM